MNRATRASTRASIIEGTRTDRGGRGGILLHDDDDEEEEVDAEEGEDDPQGGDENLDLGLDEGCDLNF